MISYYCLQETRETAMINTVAEKEICNTWATLKFKLLSFSNGLLSLGRSIRRAEMRGEAERKPHSASRLISYFQIL